MLEVYEVFDASNEELLSELSSVRAALPRSAGFDRNKLQQLEEVITQELEERGCSQAVYQALIRTLPPPEPPSLRQHLCLTPTKLPEPPPKTTLSTVSPIPLAPSSSSSSPSRSAASPTASSTHHPLPGASTPAQKTALSAASAASPRLPLPPPVASAPAQKATPPAASAASPRLPPPPLSPAPPRSPLPPHPATSSATSSPATSSAAPSRAPQPATSTSSATAPAPASTTVPELYTYDLVPDQHRDGQGDDDEDEDEGDESDEMVDDVPPPQKQLSVLEAALLAFKHEQQQLKKARHAVRRKPKGGAAHGAAARVVAPPRGGLAFAAPQQRQPPPHSSASPTAAAARPGPLHDRQAAPHQQKPMQPAVALRGQSTGKQTTGDGEAPPLSACSSSAVPPSPHAESHAPPVAREEPGSHMMSTPEVPLMATSRATLPSLPHGDASASHSMRQSFQADLDPSHQAGSVRASRASPAPLSSQSSTHVPPAPPSPPSSDYDSEQEERERAERRRMAVQQHQVTATATAAARATSLAHSPPGSRYYETARIDAGEEPGGVASDRWQDWDIMGKEVGVSEWGKSKDEDEMMMHIRQAGHRDSRYAPPSVAQLDSGLNHHQSARGGVASHQVALGKVVGAVGGSASYADDDLYSTTTSNVTVSTRFGVKRQPRGGWDDFEREIDHAEGGISEGDEDEDEDGEGEEGEDRQREEEVETSAASADTMRATQPHGGASVAKAGSAGSSRPSSSTRPPSAARAAAKASPLASAASSAKPSPQRPQRGGASPPVNSPALPIVGAVYANYFSNFCDIMTLYFTVLNHLSDTMKAGGQLSMRPASTQLSAAFSNLDVSEKYQGMVLRCTAWLQELVKRRKEVADVMARPSTGLRPRGMPAVISTNDSSWESAMPLNFFNGDFHPGGELTSNMRFYAVADDTAHPEVREVTRLAFKGIPDWELDPIDQVTEESIPRPDSASGSRPVTREGSPFVASLTSTSISLPAGRPGTSQRLAGRCHMWNLLWSWSVKVRVPFSDLMVWQKVNHFPEAKQLSRKDLLKKHLVKYQIMYGGGKLAPMFDLMPTTFVLPKEMDGFIDAFNRALHVATNSRRAAEDPNLWISKPTSSSRGRGISIVHSLKQAVATVEEPVVMQRYITDPLLIQGYKFDLRLYVLVTSFNPLEAWITRDGFARFSTVPFTLDEAALDNRLIHLTNSSVQKQRSDKGELPPFLRDLSPPGGSKCTLATLQGLLAKQKVSWDTIWLRILEVVTVSLFAAQDAIPHCVNSFELFGFDVMIDSLLKVWLLEVNSSPSLSIDTPLDREIKPRVMRQVVELVNPVPFHREALLEVLDKRLSSKGRLTRRGAGIMAGTTNEEKEMTCSHLQAVLRGTLPRRYGEPPTSQGSFECLTSSPLFDKLLKLKRPIGLSA